MSLKMPELESKKENYELLGRSLLEHFRIYFPILESFNPINEQTWIFFLSQIIKAFGMVSDEVLLSNNCNNIIEFLKKIGRIYFSSEFAIISDNCKQDQKIVVQIKQTNEKMSFDLKWRFSVYGGFVETFVLSEGQSDRLIPKAMLFSINIGKSYFLWPVIVKTDTSCLDEPLTSKNADNHEVFKKILKLMFAEAPHFQTCSPQELIDSKILYLSDMMIVEYDDDLKNSILELSENLYMDLIRGLPVPDSVISCRVKLLDSLEVMNFVLLNSTDFNFNEKLMVFSLIDEKRRLIKESKTRLIVFKYPYVNASTPILLSDKWF